MQSHKYKVWNKGRVTGVSRRERGTQGTLHQRMGDRERKRSSTSQVYLHGRPLSVFAVSHIKSLSRAGMIKPPSLRGVWKCVCTGELGGVRGGRNHEESVKKSLLLELSVD